MKPLMILTAMLFAGCAAPRSSVETKDESGSMVFNVRPSDATVSLDGSVVGKARDYDGTAKVMKVNPGTHVLKLSAPGYDDFEKRVYLSDTREVIEIDLQKASK